MKKKTLERSFKISAIHTDSYKNQRYWFDVCLNNLKIGAQTDWQGNYCYVNVLTHLDPKGLLDDDDQPD